ncbi:hypothetical protein AC579_8580 [Pseudocercospora musae]|uniref:Ste24 endopeptidase n=1 Tax=Pseudocercospora musae TaxID=113226 RepID=A0A139IAZ6_9PEZI|nr:hypothetical protein AC579_8580 [Pseudocercospora musae]
MDLLRRFGALLDNDNISWKSIIITFGVAEYALETYLAYRQYQVQQKKTIPKQLKSEVDQETFDKAQSYGRAKAKFEFVTNTWAVLKKLAEVQYNVIPLLWGMSGTLVARYGRWGLTGEITQSLVFIFANAWIDTLLGLPFSYYHHFVLEEKFGFNKQTVKLWLTDILKSQAIGIAFGVPLGAAFLKIIKATGDNFFFYVWVFLLFVQLGAITIYPTVIVPLFNKLTPLEPGDLKDRIDALAVRLHFPLGELQVIDGSKRSSHSNAYFAGLPYLKKKIVLYDTLIEQQETKEIEAVLAHELGHWKKNHTAKLLGIGSTHLFAIFALFSAFIHNNSLYKEFGFPTERPIIIGFILFNMVLSPTDHALKLIMNTLTRKFEYQADKFSYDLGYKAELASSLIKINIKNLSSMDADWMYSAYHHSHPILTERLRALGYSSEHKVSKDKPKVAGEAPESVKNGEFASQANGGRKEFPTSVSRLQTWLEFTLNVYIKFAGLPILFWVYCADHLGWQITNVRRACDRLYGLIDDEPNGDQDSVMGD